MIVAGIDLSGPTNIQDTSVAIFEGDARSLTLAELICGATDEAIFALAARLPADRRACVGLDAPLSYNPGGGDRPADRELRRAAVARGLHPGSVMTPTNTRMAFLTLRGMAVARLLEATGHPRLTVVEVHPGCAMAFRGASPADVRAFKHDPGARGCLRAWLAGQGLDGLENQRELSDHDLAACAGALAAWRWGCGQPAWLAPASCPHHPYDFAC